MLKIQRVNSTFYSRKSSILKNAFIIAENAKMIRKICVG